MQREVILLAKYFLYFHKKYELHQQRMRQGREFFMQKYSLNSVMYMYEHTCSTKRELFVYFELVIPQIHFVLVNMLITLQKHFSLLHVRFPYI